MGEKSSRKQKPTDLQRVELDLDVDGLLVRLVQLGVVVAEAEPLRATPAVGLVALVLLRDASLSSESINGSASQASKALRPGSQKFL